ncbi:MAG: hypothetical protein ACR2PG_03120, partial [Hyphomicrobiaceae bacterium]
LWDDASGMVPMGRCLWWHTWCVMSGRRTNAATARGQLQFHHFGAATGLATLGPWQQIREYMQRIICLDKQFSFNHQLRNAFATHRFLSL